MVNPMIERFRRQVNPSIAAGQEAYLRHQFKFIGLKTPVRRDLQKDYLKEKCKNQVIDWEFVFELWDLDEREFQYLAADYLVKMAKFAELADLEKLKKLIESKSWWETVDTLDEVVGTIVLYYPEQGKSTMLDWSKDENFWTRRVAINFQQKWKSQTDRQLLAKIIVNNFGSDEFFINKAIGWSLREFAKTDAAWVREFLSAYAGKMSNLSVKEASKHL